ncbi:hypothetical protein NMY22_g9117 [Coprinellus aureogranulatus]|nr:hypothetical protein NMY22_g9117 [Coprinellus aureogranulatus]
MKNSTFKSFSNYILQRPGSRASNSDSQQIVVEGDSSQVDALHHCGYEAEVTRADNVNDIPESPPLQWVRELSFNNVWANLAILEIAWSSRGYKKVPKAPTAHEDLPHPSTSFLEALSMWRKSADVIPSEGAGQLYYVCGAASVVGPQALDAAYMQQLSESNGLDLETVFDNLHKGLRPAIQYFEQNQEESPSIHCIHFYDTNEANPCPSFSKGDSFTDHAVYLFPAVRRLYADHANAIFGRKVSAGRFLYECGAAAASSKSRLLDDEFEMHFWWKWAPELGPPYITAGARVERGPIQNRERGNTHPNEPPSCDIQGKDLNAEDEDNIPGYPPPRRHIRGLSFKSVWSNLAVLELLWSRTCNENGEVPQAPTDWEGVPLPSSAFSEPLSNWRKEAHSSPSAAIEELYYLMGAASAVGPEGMDGEWARQAKDNGLDFKSVVDNLNNGLQPAMNYDRKHQGSDSFPRRIHFYNTDVDHPCPSFSGGDLETEPAAYLSPAVRTVYAVRGDRGNRQEQHFELNEELDGQSQ